MSIPLSHFHKVSLWVRANGGVADVDSSVIFPTSWTVEITGIEKQQAMDVPIVIVVSFINTQKGDNSGVLVGGGTVGDDDDKYKQD
jgi:hypothetical protein